MSHHHQKFSASYMARQCSTQDNEVVRGKRVKQVTQGRRSDSFEAEFTPKLRSPNHTTNHQPQAVLTKTLRNGKKIFTVKR